MRTSVPGSPGRNGVMRIMIIDEHEISRAAFRALLRARRVGLRTPARAFAITGIVLAALAFLGPLLVADLPFRSGQVLLPGDLWIRGTAAFLIAAAGLWVLAWAERSWALAIITLVYTGAALLASLYDVENVLYRLGWNPGGQPVQAPDRAGGGGPGPGGEGL